MRISSGQRKSKVFGEAEFEKRICRTARELVPASKPAAAVPAIGADAGARSPLESLEHEPLLLLEAIDEEAKVGRSCRLKKGSSGACPPGSGFGGITPNLSSSLLQNRKCGRRPPSGDGSPGPRRSRPTSDVSPRLGSPGKDDISANPKP